MLTVPPALYLAMMICDADIDMRYSVTCLQNLAHIYPSISYTMSSHVLIDRAIGERSELNFRFPESMKACTIAKVLEDKRGIVITQLESPCGQTVVPRDDHDTLIRDINAVPDTSRADQAVVVYYVTAPPPPPVVMFNIRCYDQRRQMNTFKIKVHKAIKASKVTRKIATRLGVAPERVRSLGCVNDPASSDAAVADIIEDFEGWDIVDGDSMSVEYVLDSDPDEVEGPEGVEAVDDAAAAEAVDDAEPPRPVKNRRRFPMTRSRTRESARPITRAISKKTKMGWHKR
jgi:hypothetical protein